MRRAFQRPPLLYPVTGIAGPMGGSRIKPVGTVWIGIAKKHGDKITASAKLFKFEDSGRKNIRKNASKAAIEMLIRAIE